MKKHVFKILSLTMGLVFLFSCFTVVTGAVNTVDYTITNPYESVTDLLGTMDNHYKTNLHTHSTYSDANETMVNMIHEFYDQDYDILAFSDHGVIGKNWDETPTLVLLYQYQILLGNKQTHLTTEEFNAVLNGTFRTPENRRTNPRGMQCVTGAIEGNMLVVEKNHVNGYFTDALEGDWGYENDFEYAIKAFEESGGVSHINHPGDWLHSAGDESIARDPENVKFFADLLNKYHSCLGIEALNAFDRPTSNDRILWDELIMDIVPCGERNVWGFANSDAHARDEVDTSFMDFILPSYSMDNLRTAMENGTFFSIGRYAYNELGDDFVGTGPYPQVTNITVDEENDTISVTGINCKEIQWIADGVVIASETREENGEITTTLKLRDYSDEIGCYVRFQLLGDGGLCLAQPFVCDDGNMADLIPPVQPEQAKHPVVILVESIVTAFKNSKIGALILKLAE